MPILPPYLTIVEAYSQVVRPYLAGVKLILTHFIQI